MLARRTRGGLRAGDRRRPRGGADDSAATARSRSVATRLRASRCSRTSSLSRRHVRITPEADGARVEDLGSRNGTFVDGDEIYGPAHLAVDGQLLVGVTVLQLRTAETVASGATALRPIPADFTALRPLPAVEPAATTIRPVAPGLAVPEAEPDYVPASALGRGGPARPRSSRCWTCTRRARRAARRSRSSCSSAVRRDHLPRRALTPDRGRRSR